MLWKNIFYGPVLSRRLGYSLGVNLLPMNRKICNYNCIYCECGLNEKEAPKVPLPTIQEYEDSLIEVLQLARSENQKIDSITFSGNGEPTLHPDFEKIIHITIDKRNEFYPESRITVLTNSTTINKEKIKEALHLIDLPICKLDAGTEQTFQLIDQPESKITLDEITANLAQFNGKLYVQTIFLRGQVGSNFVDNTTPEEINKWLERLQTIKPQFVMIYSIDRTPPYSTLEKIDKKELSSIVEMVKNLGIQAECYL
jgi:wyosine [tRNA(Phe)-imidazoG37] synthetase (radical SAM superfamily)